MTGVKAGNGRRTLRVAGLIDGTGAPQRSDAAIVIEGGTIQRVGPSADVLGDIPPGEDAAISWSDGIAVPGFVDAHVHFTLFADGRSYEAMAAEPDAMMAFAAARNALTHLRAGVTTARDNGSRNRLGFALKQAIDRGLVAGPGLLVSGRPAGTSTGATGSQTARTRSGRPSRAWPRTAPTTSRSWPAVAAPGARTPRE